MQIKTQSRKIPVVKNQHVKDMEARYKKHKAKQRTKLFNAARVLGETTAVLGTTALFVWIIAASYPHDRIRLGDDLVSVQSGDALPDAEYMDMSSIDRGGVSDAGLEYFSPESDDVITIAKADIPVPRKKPATPEWILENREFDRQLEEALATKGAEFKK